MNILEELAESYTYNGVLSEKAIVDDIVTLENQIDSYEYTLREIRLRKKNDAPLLSKIRDAKIKLSLLKALQKRAENNGGPIEPILNILGVSANSAKETPVTSTAADGKEPLPQNFSSSNLEKTENKEVINEVSAEKAIEVPDFKTQITPEVPDKDIKPVQRGNNKETETQTSKLEKTKPERKLGVTVKEEDVVVKDIPASKQGKDKVEKTEVVEKPKDKAEKGTKITLTENNNEVKDITDGKMKTETPGKNTTTVAKEETHEVNLPAATKTEVIKEETGKAISEREIVDKSLATSVSLSTEKSEETHEIVAEAGKTVGINQIKVVETADDIVGDVNLNLERYKIEDGKYDLTSVSPEELEKFYKIMDKDDKIVVMDNRKYTEFEVENMVEPEIDDVIVDGYNDYAPEQADFNAITSAFPDVPEISAFMFTEEKGGFNMPFSSSVRKGIDFERKTIQLIFEDVLDYQLFVPFLVERERERCKLFGKTKRNIFMDVTTDDSGNKQTVHFEFMKCKLINVDDSGFTLAKSCHPCSVTFKYKKLNIKTN